MGRGKSEKVGVTLVVEATGVGKTFGTGDGQTEALRGIDLRIDQGDFICFPCGRS